MADGGAPDLAGRLRALQPGHRVRRRARGLARAGARRLRRAWANSGAGCAGRGRCRDGAVTCAAALGGRGVRRRRRRPSRLLRARAGPCARHRARAAGAARQRDPVRRLAARDRGRRPGDARRHAGRRAERGGLRHADPRPGAADARDADALPLAGGAGGGHGACRRPARAARGLGRLAARLPRCAPTVPGPVGQLAPRAPAPTLAGALPRARAAALLRRDAILRAAGGQAGAVPPPGRRPGGGRRDGGARRRRRCWRRSGRRRRAPATCWST